MALTEPKPCSECGDDCWNEDGLCRDCRIEYWLTFMQCSECKSMRYRPDDDTDSARAQWAQYLWGDPCKCDPKPLSVWEKEHPNEVPKNH